MELQGPVYVWLEQKEAVIRVPVLGQWHQQEVGHFQKLSGRKWWVVRWQVVALKAGTYHGDQTRAEAGGASGLHSAFGVVQDTPRGLGTVWRFLAQPSFRLSPSKFRSGLAAGQLCDLGQVT